jgi:hypothetical protein
MLFKVIGGYAQAQPLKPSLERRDPCGRKQVGCARISETGELDLLWSSASLEGFDLWTK